MPIRISNVVKVTTKELEDKGIFDGFADIDAQLHIDPSLVENSTIPEFKNARKELQDYFSEVFALISKIKNKGDDFWKEGHKRLLFKEQGNAGLGYSNGSKHGSAIGPIIAESILKAGRKIHSAGISDPEVFEMLGLFQKDIGADRISDMTLVILLERFVEYTQRISLELNIDTKDFKVKNKIYQLPPDPCSNTYLLFIPKKFLNALPIADSWSEMDAVNAYNEQLRQQFNKKIKMNWKSIIKNHNKSQLADILVANPEIFRDLLTKYKDKPKLGYDFKVDPLGEVLWAELAETVAQKYPLDLSMYDLDIKKEIDKVSRPLKKYIR
tara:strand:+ start:13788 stop:14765 length:978 start_codon:yes stop_codon:yes gene_type:complete